MYSLGYLKKHWTQYSAIRWTNNLWLARFLAADEMAGFFWNYLSSWKTVSVICVNISTAHNCKTRQCIMSVGSTANYTDKITRNKPWHSNSWEVLTDATFAVKHCTVWFSRGVIATSMSYAESKQTWNLWNALLWILLGSFFRIQKETLEAGERNATQMVFLSGKA